MTDALRQAAENAADVLDEARTYVGCESWSPSMLEECERALRMLRAALAQPPAPTADQTERAQAIAAAFSRGHDDGWQACSAHIAAHAPAPTAQPAADDRLRMSLQADLAIESLAVDDLLRAMGEDPEQYRTDGGTVNRLRLLAWLKDRDAQPVQQPGDNINCKSVQKRLAVQAAPAQRQPLSDEQIEHLARGVARDDMIHDFARAIEAAHGIAAQKGEKL